MDTLSKLKICTAYKLHNEQVNYPPTGSDLLSECEPVYEEMPGWESITAGITEFDQLPAKAQHYIARLEELVGVPFHIISTGPERNENVVVKNPF